MLAIFNKICLVVGQIVVGSILGFLVARVSWRWIDWMEDRFLARVHKPAK